MSHRLPKEDKHHFDIYYVTVYKKDGIYAREFDNVYSLIDEVHYILEYEMAKGKCAGMYIGLKSRGTA